MNNRKIRMNNSIKLTILLLAVLFTSCVDRFTPEIKGYENLLVIEGILTNEEETTYLKISRSYSVDSLRNTNVDAVAYIEDSRMNKTYFVTDINDPSIQRITPGFQAEIGETYVLHIIVDDNETYTSSPVTLLKTPEIDSIYLEYKTRINSDNENEKYAQIYLDTHDETDNTRFYRWNWSEAYEINTPLVSLYLLKNMKVKQRSEDEMINRCWLFDENKSIVVRSTKHLSKDVVSHQPLVSFSSSSLKPKVLYSIKVDQYALSEESYNFYSHLQKVSEGVGSLFDPQPAQVIGNIKRDQDPNELVLGIFEANTASSLRVFFSPRDLREIVFSNTLFPSCKSEVVEKELVAQYVGQGYNMIMHAGLPPADPEALAPFVMAHKKCTDCTIFGTKNKPDYWPR